MYAIEMRFNEDDSVEFKLNAEQFFKLRRLVETGCDWYFGKWSDEFAHCSREEANKAEETWRQFDLLRMALYVNNNDKIWKLYQKVKGIKEDTNVLR